MKTTHSHSHLPVNRRRFIGLLGATFTLAVLPSLTACHSFEPKPFVTGEIVKAPLGCQELLKRDQQGDC